MSTSVKHRFLQHGGGEDDDFDNLILVDPSPYKPGPTGDLAHKSLARTKTIRGGLGSGKTRWAGEQINNLMIAYPGAMALIGRRDATTLRDTTQKEYLEMVVRPQTIQTFNVNDNTLHYKNGSSVIFRDVKTKNDVKSLQLLAYMIDEADENPDEDIWSYLDDRLRQPIFGPTGEKLLLPYQGLLVFNPTDEDHWLYTLAHRTDIDVEDFRFPTHENAHNLPDNYIPNLEKKLPPWERRRLIEGHWGRQIKGKPVYHGFQENSHVKNFGVQHGLPMMRAWDFGYGHPAVSWMQIDHITGRVFVHREYLGTSIKIHDVVKHVEEITNALCGPAYPILDYGDPHGADEKDTSVSSIEWLRIHKGIFVQHRRDRIKTGMEEIQSKILADAAVTVDNPDIKWPLFVVHPTCKVTIDAYLGGYHRGPDGTPEKDGYFDHIPDTHRYCVVHNMNRVLAHKRQNRRYRPKNLYTGY